MTKIMVQIKERRTRYTGQNITIGEYNFEAVGDIVYLGAVINPKK